MATELEDKQGNLVKWNGETIFRADMTGAILKGVDLEKRTMWITGTTEAKDRDGDVVMLNGWDVKNYLKNPVFMWAHDYTSVPIGAAKRVVRRREPKRMDFLMEFADMKDLWTFPELIMQMYADGKINASSVGFIPRKHEPMEKDPEDTCQMWPGRRFLIQELLELSGCAVPSNPEALANSFKGYGRFESMPEDRQKRLLEYLIDGSHPEKVEEAKEIIEHQIASKCEFVDELEPKKVFINVKVEREETEFTTKDLEEILKKVREIKEYITLDEWLDPPEEVREVTEWLGALLHIEPEEKQGAVLSKKNKDLLQAASDNILKVLESAEPQEEASEEGKTEGEVVGHFEYLVHGELPKTQTHKTEKKRDPEKKVSAPEKGEDKTDDGDVKGPSVEEMRQRLQVFSQELRNEFPQLFPAKGGK